MISSIRLDGSTACMAIEGAANGEVFCAYVRHVLSPTLHPGDVVILDNLSTHKNAEATRLIEEVGAQVIFLPAYSPDLNPIEQMWSKVKESLRAEKARDKETLLAAIGAAFRKVSEKDAINWFANCGYSLN